MSADPADSEDGPGKMITSKEKKLLAAINGAESTVLDAVSQEYAKLSGGRELQLEKFVEAFRKYSPYFVQMLTADSSDDSDEDDVAIPSKVYRFINAFTNSRDKIVAAINHSYMELHKKELKDLNFSIFQNHPQEIFKSYSKSTGGMTQSSSFPSSSSHMDRPSPSIVERPSPSTARSEKTPVPSLGAREEAAHAMNANDVSLDLEESGSLVSGQEEELRRTMGSASSTPTPTVEDWNGIKQSATPFREFSKPSNGIKHVSGEKWNESSSMTVPASRMTTSDRTFTDAMNTRPKLFERVEKPDAVPLTVPSSTMRSGEYGRPLHTISSPDQYSLPTQQHQPIPPPRGFAFSQMDANHPNLLHPNMAVNGCPPPSAPFQPILPRSANPFKKESTPIPTPPTPSSTSAMSGVVPSMGTGRLDWKGNGKKTEEMNEHAKETREMSGQKSSEVGDTVETMLIDGLKEKVREDLRFYVPSMIERAMRVYQMEKRPATLRQLIGEEFYDERLEKFTMKMMGKDKGLQEIFHVEKRRDGETVVHLRQLMGKNEQVVKETRPVQEVDTHPIKEVESHPIEKAESRPIERAESRPIKETATLDLIPLPNRIPAIVPSFLYSDTELPLKLKKEECDVLADDEGVIGVFVFSMSERVDAQLEELRPLDIAHLSLSNARHVEKGTKVVAMSANHTYCRGIVMEEWKRDDDTTPDEGVVQCRLIDYGNENGLPLNVLYQFPGWADTVLPAVIIKCRVDAVPMGAKSKDEKFSAETWEEIKNLFFDWMEEDGEMRVLRYDGEMYCIDVMKGEESLVHLLEIRGLAQQMPHSIPIDSLSSSPSHPTVSPLLAKLHTPTNFLQFSENETTLTRVENVSERVDTAPSTVVENQEMKKEKDEEVSVPVPVPIPISIPSVPLLPHEVVTPAPSAMFLPSHTSNISFGTGASDVPRVESIPVMISPKLETSLSSNVDDEKEDSFLVKMVKVEEKKEKVNSAAESIVNAMNEMAIDPPRSLLVTPSSPPRSSLLINSDPPRPSIIDLSDSRPSPLSFLQVVRPQSPPSFVSTVLEVKKPNRRLVEIVSEDDTQC